MTFTTWDYVVFAITLVISAGIGIYTRFTGGRQKTLEEYLMADRSMPIWPVSFSLMASFMSAITLLGVSNENYSYGTQFVVINIAYGLGTPLITHLYLPVFYNMRVTSVYEYLEKRFGIILRLVASISYSFQMILYMGIVLFAPALALETVTGIPMNYSIVIIGVVCSFYSIIGGMRAVLLTDAFQSILMFGAVLTVSISGLVYAGGFSEIFATADKGGRLELWNFQIDPTVRHSWFSLIIGGIGTYLSLYAVSQAQVQRLLSVKTLHNARMSLWWQWPILSALSLITSFSGLVIYWYYHDCDPVNAGRINARDQNMPRYILDALGHMPGIAGLFVAGIFSASLSTVSTALNSLAALTLEDYFKNVYKLVTKNSLEISNINSALISKILATIYGALCIGVAFLTQNMTGVLQISLTIFGVVGGPLLGVFSLGMFTQVANQWGALIGHLTGVAIALWSQLGQPRPGPKYLPFSTENCERFNNSRTINPFLLHHDDNIHKLSFFESARADDDDSNYFYLYRVSYMYAVVIGFLVTFILGYVFSYIFYLLKLQTMDNIYIDKETKEINADLFSPPIAMRLRKIFQKKNEK